MGVESKFMEWLHAAGIACPKCMIGSVQEGDRGVLASGNIEKGDVIVSVPDESVLMPENCSAAQVLPLCRYPC
jgi:hypothetical protein